MKKQENQPNKVVTFKIAGQSEPTPNPVYDCAIPIYPVDFACQHKKPAPWWERELTFTQLQDLLNICYYELDGELKLYHNEVKDQLQRDLEINANNEKINSLAVSLNDACICQRSLDCELEILAYQMDCQESIIQCFENFYSRPMRENQCKFLVYRYFADVFINLKQLEYNLNEIHLECNNESLPFRERGNSGKISLILDVLVFTMEKIEKKIEEMTELLVLITAARQRYVTTATEYAVKTNNLALISDIEKYKKNLN